MPDGLLFPCRWQRKLIPPHDIPGSKHSSPSLHPQQCRMSRTLDPAAFIPVSPQAFRVPWHLQRHAACCNTAVSPTHPLLHIRHIYGHPSGCSPSISARPAASGAAELDSLRASQQRTPCLASGRPGHRTRIILACMPSTRRARGRAHVCVSVCVCTCSSCGAGGASSACGGT